MRSTRRCTRLGRLAALLLPGAATLIFAAGGRADGPPLLIRGGTVVVKVARYDDAHQQVLQAAAVESAALLDARTEVTEKGRKYGWMRFRLPSERLDSLLLAVAPVGKLYAENRTTTGRASEYEGLTHRAERLREHAQRLDALLHSERRLRGSDILFVQERLFRATVDADLLRQQRADIERAAQTSSVVVFLFEPEPVRALDQAQLRLGSAFAGARRRAETAASRLVGRGLTGAAYALVFAPLWLPLMGVAVALGYRLRRRGGSPSGPPTGRVDKPGTSGYIAR